MSTEDHDDNDADFEDEDEDEPVLPKDAILNLHQVVCTPGLAARMHPAAQLERLARHAKCDFGLIDRGDKRANLRTLDDGPGMIMSVYLIDEDQMDTGTNRMWIITDQVAMVTTLLLPEEY